MTVTAEKPKELPFVEAEKLARVADQLTDDELGQVWRSYASMISYYHSDDTGLEWGEARKLKPDLQNLDEEHDRRGLPRPLRAGWLL